ncbi:DNA replication protein DnaD [compost metagenome]
MQPKSGAAAATVGKGIDPAEEETPSLFVVFEREFGRPLSPMEFETIAGWLDQDRYPEELIRLALKESVFAGKVYFRYIDRILLEWSRNRVKNAQDVKAYSQRFRGGS